jgi:ribose transport system substrate-binding protein
MHPRWLAILFAAALLVAGCSRGGGGNEPAKENKAQPQKTGKTVGLSVLTMTNPFFKEIGDSFTDELGKHGYEAVVVSGDEDQARQKAQVEDFLAKGVAAIVLCPCNSQTVGEAIRLANKQGVPVFTADIACLDKSAKVVAHIATNNLAGGKQAAEAMIEAIGDAGGKVLILDNKSLESCLLRVQGFKEVIKIHNMALGKLKNKGGRGQRIEIVAELPGDGDKEQAAKKTADALVTNPDLAGIFAINDPSALGAYAALVRAGKEKDVKIIGYDGQPEGKQAIKEGKIYADPIQHPGQIGRKTARAVVDYFDGKTPEPEILIPTRLYRQGDAERK